MFKRIRQKVQCLKGKSRKSNVLKNKVKNLLFKRIRGEFQCIKG